MNEHKQPNSVESTGTRLARLRRSLNITQEELAERLGISRQAISKWESDLAYPETEKLLLLSRLYGCTVDYLLTGEEPSASQSTQAAAPDVWTRLGEVWRRRPRYFEYKSQKKVGSLPLVHINIGLGRKAKGVIAIGLAAKGIVSLGLASMGVLSAGLCSVGILSLGVLSLGLLFAVGSIAVGAVAIGAIAVGLLAIGALAVGLFSVGALAVGHYVAIGDHAYGMFAWGNTVANGQILAIPALTPQEISDRLPEIETFIDKHIPAFLRWIARMLVYAVW